MTTREWRIALFVGLKIKLRRTLVELGWNFKGKWLLTDREQDCFYRACIDCGLREWACEVLKMREEECKS